MALFASLVGCGSSDAASQGEGDVSVTSWGEGFVEQGIPADPDAGGFSDGWSLTWQKFLVVIGAIEVGTERESVAELPSQILVDHVSPGVKPLVTFETLPARAYPSFAFEIAPPGADLETYDGVDPADRDRMVEDGYSVLVAGTATKDDRQIAFEWGFDIATRYTHCKAEIEGREIDGLVVSAGARETVELTIHGDHFFYDRLQASDDPAQPTSLRFDELAAADADEDGTLTLAELSERPIDVRRYNPSPFDAPDYGAFVRALARTIGHYRGEGECEIEVRSE